MAELITTKLDILARCHLIQITIIVVSINLSSQSDSREYVHAFSPITSAATVRSGVASNTLKSIDIETTFGITSN